MKWRLFNTSDNPVIPPNATTLNFNDEGYAQVMIIEGSTAGEKPPITEVQPLAFSHKLETPATGSTLTGTFHITGWATQYQPATNTETLTGIELAFNGLNQGIASNYGILRNDVTLGAEYKNKNIGFDFTFNADRLPNGTNLLILRYYAGPVLVMEEGFEVIVNEAVATPLRFFVDQPLENGAVQDVYRFQGWACQWDATNNRDNIQSIDFLLNSTKIGNCTMGIARPDVVASIPDCHNPNSGWQYDLDTTALPNQTALISFIVHKLVGPTLQQDMHVRIMTQSTEPVDPPPPVVVPVDPPVTPDPDPVIPTFANAQAIGGVNFRSSASSASDSNKIRMISNNEFMKVIQIIDSTWAKMQDKNGVTGYASMAYFKFVKPAFDVYGDSVIKFGMQFEGRLADGKTPKHDYAFGSAQKNPDTFDCSGFTNYCFKNLGLNLGTTMSCKQAQLDAKGMQKITKLADLKKGDIMFFDNGSRNDCGNTIDHVGICAADGGTFILHTFRVGVGVIYMDMSTTVASDNVKINSSTFWKTHFKWGLRPVNSAGTGWVKI